MAIQMRNKRRAEFNSTSMADLVFLLLIFFMLSSTLIAPNAVKLLLPSSNSKTLAKPASVTVYIDASLNFYIDGIPVEASVLETGLTEKLKGEQDASVVLKANKDVTIQYIVMVIDAVNNVNKLTGTKHKVILATQPFPRS
jgi:biopolymer transport protein ExbD